jgi:hypothetical protein
MNDNNKFDYDEIREKWNLRDLSRYEEIRVPKKAAEVILLSNVSITIEGRVRWFSLERIGVGVYKVRLSDFGSKQGNYLIR